MEERTPVRSNDKPRHRALTPLRVLRGMICLLVLFLTAFIILVYYGFVTSVPLRFFSIHYSRKATSFFFGAWLALWPFLFEKINNTRVVISGDSVPAKERVLLIANHRTEVDWMYLWDLALRKGRLGYVKYILKRSLMKLPIFGWAFHILEFIPVERKWDVDQSTMHKMLSTFQNPEDPLWLALFPEGTDFTEQKCIRSQKYAAENGLPLLKNVLLPKTKGFYACLEALRDTLDAVYDITIGYKNRCPSFLDNAFGVNPSEVHLHVRRIPLSDVPMSEDAVSDWLKDRFCVKDKLLSDFHATGRFAHPETEGELPMVKCLVHCLFAIVLTVTGSYLTLFGSIWFRIYVSLACAYLASATYFNIKPMPIFGIFKSCKL